MCATTSTNNNTFAPYYLSPESIPEELHCSICTHPFVEPVTLKARSKEEQCNHTFCSSCITSWLSSKEGAEHRCPYCQAEVSRRFSTADRPICNMVNSLRVHCKYYHPSSSPPPSPLINDDPISQSSPPTTAAAAATPLGCGWVGTRSEWAGHLAGECLCREVECPHRSFGCEWSSTRSMLESHLTECSYEAVRGLICRVTQLEGNTEKLQKYQAEVEGLLSQVVEHAEQIQRQLMRPLSCSSSVSTELSHFKTHMKEVLGQITETLLLFRGRVVDEK